MNKTTYTLSDLTRAFIGADRMFDDMQQKVTTRQYPPYDIVKTGENSYEIRLAVAGFKLGDFTIKQDKDTLIIDCHARSHDEDYDDNDTTEYLHQGIAMRAFTRKFTLAEYVDVVNAQLTNGILTVKLERELPDEMAPRTIKISE